MKIQLYNVHLLNNQQYIDSNDQTTCLINLSERIHKHKK